VFVDVGSGLGRAGAFVHLLTGARVVGIEVQSGLVHAARDLTARLALSCVSYVEGDAATRTGVIAIGSVFFFYCPFSGDRLVKVLGDLEVLAHTRLIRVCCLDLPLPPCPWLTLESPLGGDLAIYRSTLLAQVRDDVERRDVLEPAALGLGLDDLAAGGVRRAARAAPWPTRTRSERGSGGVPGRTPGERA
jgi:hypothetical protein